MPVFDFNAMTSQEQSPECTYTTFQSNESRPSPQKPILILENKKRNWEHHSIGFFMNPNKRSAFEFEDKEKKCRKAQIS